MIDKIDTNYYVATGTIKREVNKEEIIEKINEMIEQINKLEGTNVENDTSDFCEQVSYISGRKDESEAWKHKIENKMNEIYSYTFTSEEEDEKQKYAINRLKELLEE